jgi:hypothetical protein
MKTNYSRKQRKRQFWCFKQRVKNHDFNAGPIPRLPPYLIAADQAFKKTKRYKAMLKMFSAVGASSLSKHHEHRTATRTRSQRDHARH